MIPTPSPRAPGGRLRAARLTAVLLTMGLFSAGCSARDAYETAFGTGFLQPVTKQGENIYELWLASSAAAAVVGIFVWLLILWAGFRYRKKSDLLPRQVRYNLPIEVLYTVVPFVIIAVLFYYTTISQNFVNELTDDDQGNSAADVNIGVVGFQWNWSFNYVDEGVGTTGQTTQPAELVLPVDRSIRIVETSPDVIHSFYVPAFLFKRDVIPGRENTFEITITKPGEYVGRCAELCGEKHSAMNFVVRAVPMAEYQAQVARLKQDPANRISQTGQGAVVPQGEATEGDVS